MGKHLNILFPQWQGGGIPATWEGAMSLKRNYLQEVEHIEIPVETTSSLEKKNGIIGYEPIMRQMKSFKRALEAEEPDTLFVMGGGDDVDILPPAYCNRQLNGDMTLLFFDAHGDLNSPESSPSGNLHGMPLRAMLGECDKGILGLADSVLKPEQIIMIGTRDCDPPEEEFICENQIVSLRSELVNQNPSLILDEIKKKGSKNVFIHVDIDVIDPSEFPYQPVPAPNGVQEKAFCEMLEIVKENCNIAGMCILGYTAMPDGQEKDKALETLVQMGASL